MTVWSIDCNVQHGRAFPLISNSATGAEYGATPALLLIDRDTAHVFTVPSDGVAFGVCSPAVRSIEFTATEPTTPFQAQLFQVDAAGHQAFLLQGLQKPDGSRWRVTATLANAQSVTVPIASARRRQTQPQADSTSFGWEG